MLGENKKVHLQLFLIKDIKDVLPTKKLLKSRIAKISRDEEEYLTREYWYEYTGQKLLAYKPNKNTSNFFCLV